MAGLLAAFANELYLPGILEFAGRWALGAGIFSRLQQIHKFLTRVEKKSTRSDLPSNLSATFRPNLPSLDARRS